MECSTTLPERVQQQQTAVWELVQTEAAYIHTLKVVTDVGNYFIIMAAVVNIRIIANNECDRSVKSRSVKYLALPIVYCAII